MKKISRFLYSVFATVVLSLYACSSSFPISEKEFISPSRNYGPMTWWHWVNGNVTKDGILKDLIAMQKVGLRGVQMFNAHMYLPKGPIEFCTDEWVDLVSFAIEKCDSLGLVFTMTNAAGWSGACGPWITPERAMKKVVFSELQIQGGKHLELRLKTPETIGEYYKDIAVLAVPAEYEADKIPDLQSKIMMGNSAITYSKDNNKIKAVRMQNIIDLSSSADAEGNLDCSLPNGDWTILRFGFTLTGKKGHPCAWGGEGYECDKLNAEHVEYQFDHSLGKVIKANKKYLGNTFEGILFDSYEGGYQNWTEKMPEEFSSTNGYDLTPYLVLFTGRYVDDVATSEKILWDFRKTLDNLMAKNFYGKMQELVHRNNLIVYAEGQGCAVSSHKAYDYVDIPMNEFWMPDTKPRLEKIRLTTSLGNLKGRNIIAAESFTSKPEDARWQNTPWRMKKAGDLAFAGGINRYCLHSYAHQPESHAIPGFTMGRYGTMFNRLSTWWDYSEDWFAYITRSQYLLQQGRTVSNICFLFPNDIRYSFPDTLVKLPFGYSYRIIYPEDIENASVEDGEIVLENGMRFKLLIMADNLEMEHGCLKKLEVLVKEGASICNNADTKDKDGLISEIAPDVSCKNHELEDSLYYLHRRTCKEDIYYLTNQTNSVQSYEISFNVNGRIPEIWDPKSGKVAEATSYDIGKDRINIKCDFDPYGAYFIVFRKKTSRNGHFSNPVKNSVGKAIDASKDWKVIFEDKKQKISGPVHFAELSLWNESEDERIKHYSGTAEYSNIFFLSKSDIENANSVELSLGENLYDIARVFVNDKEVGIVWAKPFALDITSDVIPGENHLRILVANTWINRIIGDEAIPDREAVYETEGSKFTIGRATALPWWVMGSNKMPDERKRITYATWKHYNSDSPLVKSGLEGPVIINIIK